MGMPLTLKCDCLHFLCDVEHDVSPFLGDVLSLSHHHHHHHHFFITCDYNTWANNTLLSVTVHTQMLVHSDEGQCLC